MNKCESSVKYKKRRELLKDSYTPAQAAEILKLSKRTVLTYCETGEIKAVPQPYGTQGRMTYIIPKIALKAFMDSKRETKKPLFKDASIVLKGQTHKQFVDLLKDKLEDGTMTGKVFSPRTVEHYVWLLKKFFETNDYLTSESLEDYFRTPYMKGSFAQKEKMHRAAVCFAKLLIRKKLLVVEELKLIQELKPIDHRPQKRHDVKYDEIVALMEYAKTQSALNYAILCVFIGTGLRASEVCNIVLEDLDLENQELSVITKGNRYRRIGFPDFTLQAIKEWLKVRKDYMKKNPDAQILPWLFLSNKGKQLRRDSVRERLIKMCNRLNKKIEDDGGTMKVHANPHAIRRAYVTINLNSGQLLPHVSKAVGHTRIKTTEIYDRTSQNTVVNAMKRMDITQPFS